MTLAQASASAEAFQAWMQAEAQKTRRVKR